MMFTSFLYVDPSSISYILFTAIGVIIGGGVLALLVLLIIKIIKAIVRLFKNVQASKESQLRMEEMYRMEHPDISDQFDKREK